MALAATQGVVDEQQAQQGKAAISGSLAGLSLKANFAWTLAGNVVYAGCQWGMLVALSKLGTPDLVGQFALALAVTAPVLMLTNLQLRQVQATDARKEYLFADYLALRLLATFVSFIAIAGLVAISGYGEDTALVILIVGLAKCFEAISDVVYGLLQQHERMDRIAVSMIIKGLLSLGALAVVVRLTGSVVWGVGAMAAVWALVMVSYDLRSAALVLSRPGSSVPDGGLAPRWMPRLLGRLVILSLPLGFVMMLISLSTNIPRYFVEHYRGSYELGIFAAMAYLMVAGNTVVFALGQAASPRLALYYASSNHDAFRSLLAKVSALALVLGMAGIVVALVAGRPLLSLLYSPEYANHSEVFVWTMIASAVSYVASVLGFGMTAARRFREQAPLFVAVTIATLAACAVLVPGLGLLGAALALVVSPLVQLAGSLLVLARALSAGKVRAA